MLEIGLSTCDAKLDDPCFLENCHKAGITNIEISMGGPECDALDIKALVAKAGKFGVRVWSMHLPFYPWLTLNPADLDENVRTYTVDFYKKLIEKAAPEGVKIFVVHASLEPNDDAIRPRIMEQAKKSLATVQDFADKFGATIAVEDLPRTCLGRNSDDIKELLSAHPNLRICFDTNHLTLEKPEDFVKEVGDKIVTLHVSDYDSTDERHWLPGEGTIDWNSLYDAICEAGYKGPWLYEIGFAADETIKRRDMTCEDFVRNAREIMERKPITTFHKHVLQTMTGAK